MNHPPAEVHVNVQLVRRLLESNCPELARQPIRLIDAGWDNFTFQVGQEHALRLPRREAAVKLLLNEQRWLPVLAPRLPLAVPVPVYSGQPSELLRWPWSLVRWIPGKTAEDHKFNRSDVEILARTLRALHQPAAPDAPVNPFRGVPLHTRSELVEARLSSLKGRVDTGNLLKIFVEACSASESKTMRWLHGDLHPRNVLVRGGSLAGLIDWGDVCGGDVATDLACAWLLLETAADRQRMFELYEVSDPARSRARGWAVHLGLALATSGEPRHLPLGLTTLDRVLARGR